MNDPERMEFTSRLAGFAVSGGVFLGVGGFITAVALYQVVLEGLSPAYLLLGVVPALGAALLTWRRGAVVDRRAGTVTAWWGFLAPFRRTVHLVRDFESVRVIALASIHDRTGRALVAVRPHGPERHRLPVHRRAPSDGGAP